MSSTTTGLYTQCPLSFRIFEFIFTCLHKQNDSVGRLLLFSFLRVSRRRRRCYPPPRFREEELIHQSSSSSSASSRGRGSGREKSSRRSTHQSTLLLLTCALFLTSAFQSIEYFSFFSLSPQKKTRMSKRSFLGDGTTLSSSSSLIISAAASAASVHPLYQKLLSSLLTTKTQQNHHRHHFCRRSWYSSESSKEELEKEIGYYTGTKTESVDGHAFTPIRSKTSTERVVRDVLEAILLVRRK